MCRKQDYLLINLKTKKTEIINIEYLSNRYLGNHFCSTSKYSFVTLESHADKRFNMIKYRLIK
jgi:hypothetical protein